MEKPSGLKPSGLKQITLIRHGEATRAGMGQDDLSRVLTKRGEQMASCMGAHLLSMGLNPDLVLASHAPRALKTAQIIAQALGYAADNIQVEANIYRARGVEPLFKLLQQVDESVNQLILVGHNPYISEMVTALDPSAKIAIMDLCAIAHFELAVEYFGALAPSKQVSCARLVAHQTPDLS